MLAKKLSLEVNVNSQVPQSVFSDKKRFKQILFNLMGNAIKFTFEGKISINLTFDEPKSQLKTEVEDSGIGIKAEDLLKLF